MEKEKLLSLPIDIHNSNSFMKYQNHRGDDELSA